MTILKTCLLDTEMNPLCNHFNLGMWHDERNIIECLLSERESWDPPIWVKRLLMCKMKPLCSTYILYASLSLTMFVLKQPTLTYERHGSIYTSFCVNHGNWRLGLISCFSRCPKYPTQWASLPCPLTRAGCLVSVSGHHFLTPGMCPIALIYHYNPCHLKACKFQSYPHKRRRMEKSFH